MQWSLEMLPMSSLMTTWTLHSRSSYLKGVQDTSSLWGEGEYNNYSQACCCLILFPTCSRYYKEDSALTLDVGPFTKALEVCFDLYMKYISCTIYVQFASGIEATVIGKPAPSFFKSALSEFGVPPGEVWPFLRCTVSTFMFSVWCFAYNYYTVSVNSGSSSGCDDWGRCAEWCGWGTGVWDGRSARQNRQI